MSKIRMEVSLIFLCVASLVCVCVSTCLLFFVLLQTVATNYFLQKRIIPRPCNAGSQNRINTSRLMSSAILNRYVPLNAPELCLFCWQSGPGFFWCISISAIFRVKSPDFESLVALTWQMCERRFAAALNSEGLAMCWLTHMYMHLTILALGIFM